MVNSHQMDDDQTDPFTPEGNTLARPNLFYGSHVLFATEGTTCPDFFNADRWRYRQRQIDTGSSDTEKPTEGGFPFEKSDHEILSFLFFSFLFFLSISFQKYTRKVVKVCETS